MKIGSVRIEEITKVHRQYVHYKDSRFEEVRGQSKWICRPWSVTTEGPCNFSHHVLTREIG